MDFEVNPTGDSVYEVDRENFDRLFPEIIEAIRKATFFGIDLEFTALRSDDRYRTSLFDDIQTRYDKLRLGLRDVAIHQFGLALFSMTAGRHYE